MSATKHAESKKADLGIKKSEGKKADAKPKAAKKAAATKSSKKASMPKVQEVETPRGDNNKILAGTPGPGPKVGDSTFQSPKEDSMSKGRPTSDSDGSHAGSLPRANKGEEAAAGAIEKTTICDRVVFVTDGRNPGKSRPALVMRITDPELPNAADSPVDVVVFPDSGKYPNNDHLGNVLMREGVRYSEGCEPGTWHWPQDDQKLIAARAQSDALALDQAAARKNG